MRKTKATAKQVTDMMKRQDANMLDDIEDDGIDKWLGDVVEIDGMPCVDTYIRMERHGKKTRQILMGRYHGSEVLRRGQTVTCLQMVKITIASDPVDGQFVIQEM